MKKTPLALITALLALLLTQTLIAADTSAAATDAVKAGEETRQAVAAKTGEAKAIAKEEAEEEEPDCD